MPELATSGRDIAQAPMKFAFEIYIGAFSGSFRVEFALFVAPPCLPTCVTRMHTATPQPPQTALLAKVSEAFRKTLVGRVKPTLAFRLAETRRAHIRPRARLALFYPSEMWACAQIGQRMLYPFCRPCTIARRRLKGQIHATLPTCSGSWRYLFPYSCNGRPPTDPYRYRHACLIT